MKWFSVRIKTVPEAEDLLIGSLYLRGFEGAQIEDHIPLTPLEKEQMFVDILPETDSEDQAAYLTFYLELDENGCVSLNGESIPKSDIEGIVREELDDLDAFDIDLGELTITTGETEDLDWINNWKKFFHSFTIDDLLVIPSWEEEPDDKQYEKILHIDPGTAFGTGMHETTQLCIRQIKNYLTSDTEMLDVGTGSGILGIIALMYGARHIMATDLDPCTVPAVADNLARNGIDEKCFDLKIGNLIDDKDTQDWAGFDRYDIVTANILADVLVPLMPSAVRTLKKGGVMITSGILAGKEDMVAQAMKDCGLEITDISSQGEWKSVTGRRK